MSICVSCMEEFWPWSGELTCMKCCPRPKVRSHYAPKNLKLSDGGATADGIREANDCTVRAMAIACDVRYRDAYQWLAANGRKPGKGCAFSVILRRNGHRAFGCQLRPSPVRPAKGLKTFLERNPVLRTGVWILHSTHHASTLKDGILFDSFDSSRKRFDGAWQILKEDQ